MQIRNLSTSSSLALTTSNELLFYREITLPNSYKKTCRIQTSVILTVCNSTSLVSPQSIEPFQFELSANYLVTIAVLFINFFQTLYHVSILLLFA